MIKNILQYGCCLAVLFTANICLAQEVAQTQETQTLIQMQNQEKAARVDINKIVEEGKAGVFSEDLLLQTLLSVPYNKRQYIFPAVHEGELFSKRLKTHPEIIVWKGKVPTDIPPQLKEFAKKHLNNLHPLLYATLDPDIWQTIDKSATNPYSWQWDSSLWDKQAMTRANYFYTMPDVNAFYKMTPEAKENFNKVTVNETHIKNLQATIQALPDFYASVKDPRETEMLMRHAFQTRQDLMQNFAYPFKGLADRINAAGETKAFEAFIQKQGWKNIDEFTEKSDTILKAHRVEHLVPLVAMQLAKIRALFPIKPGEEMTSMQMYAKLYEANAGDAMFVLRYKDQLKALFENEFFGKGRMPIYLD